MAFCPRHSPGVWTAPPVSRNWKGGTAGQAPTAPRNSRATKNTAANTISRIFRGIRSLMTMNTNRGEKYLGSCKKWRTPASLLLGTLAFQFGDLMVEVVDGLLLGRKRGGGKSIEPLSVGKGLAHAGVLEGEVVHLILDAFQAAIDTVEAFVNQVEPAGHLREFGGDGFNGTFLAADDMLRGSGDGGADGRGGALLGSGDGGADGRSGALLGSGDGGADGRSGALLGSGDGGGGALLGGGDFFAGDGADLFEVFRCHGSLSP